MARQKERTIAAEREHTVRSVLFRWEALLLLILIAINIVNANISPNYLNIYNLFTNISSFMVKGFVALPMAYILLLGDIDLSVGAIVCLAATMLGIVYNASGSIVLAILAAVATGTVCGVFNGLILTKFPELVSMIVTLATMTLFRGLSERILGDGSTSGMRDITWFSKLYDARIGPIPVMFLVFCVFALVFGIVMHKTVFGRSMYAIGANSIAARYAGIDVGKIRLMVFTLSGLMCGIASMFYCSWMGTVKNDVAEGYEMEAICMCVLGGFSTSGGKGNFIGAVISIFIVGLLRYGLGLINVNSQVIRIVIGALVVLVVMFGNINFKGTGKKMKERSPEAKKGTAG